MVSIDFKTAVSLSAGHTQDHEGNSSVEERKPPCSPTGGTGRRGLTLIKTGEGYKG